MIIKKYSISIESYGEMACYETLLCYLDVSFERRRRVQPCTKKKKKQGGLLSLLFIGSMFSSSHSPSSFELRCILVKMFPNIFKPSDATQSKTDSGRLAGINGT